MIFDDDARPDDQPDDLLDWFLTSPEFRRDRNLRRDIEALSSSRWQSDIENSRLRRQLGEVQMAQSEQLQDVVRRLEAYMELDTLRDSLDPRSKATRLAAAAMIEQLAMGQRPEPMDTGAGDYDLPFAMNAIRGQVLGEPDEESLRRALSIEPSSELLVVTAVAGLGRGDDVAERLPGVLANDGTLTGPQRVVFDAVLEGAFGPDALARCRDVLVPGITDDGWVEWLGEDPSRKLVSLVTGEEDGGAPRLMEWTPGEAPAEAVELAPAPPDLSRLRSTAGQLIMAGRRDERPRLQRVEELSRVAFAIPEPERSDSRAVTDIVRDALTGSTMGADARRELISWIEPQLRPVVESLRPQESAPSVRKVTVGTELVPIRADSDLPDPASAAAEAVAKGRAAVRGFNTAAVVLGVAGLIGFVALLKPALIVALVVLAAAIGGAAWTRSRAKESAAAVNFHEMEVSRQRRELEEAKRWAASSDAASANERATLEARLQQVEDILDRV